MIKNNSPIWMFWTLAPFFVLSVLVVTLCVYMQEGVISKAVVLIFDSLCVFGLLSFLNPVRFRWAVRSAGLIIFLSYIAYLVYMLFESGGKFTIGSRKSEMSVFNALMGLLVFGLPGIMVAVTGKLPSFFKESEDELEDEFDD